MLLLPPAGFVKGSDSVVYVYLTAASGALLALNCTGRNYSCPVS